MSRTLEKLRRFFHETGRGVVGSGNREFGFSQFPECGTHRVGKVSDGFGGDQGKRGGKRFSPGVNQGTWKFMAWTKLKGAAVIARSMTVLVTAGTATGPG